jgi:nitrogen regulatory protein PII-like uncharacterized protein
MKFNRVNMVEVDARSKDNYLRYFMNILAKVDVSPIEYEELIMKTLGKYFVVTFVVQREQYYEKLELPEHPNIVFKLIDDRKARASYLMVICQHQTFYKHSKLIEEQIAKLGPLIVGARFFNYLEPSFRFFNFDKDSCFILKYPKFNPYSMIVYARRREGHVFDWKTTFAQILSLEKHYSK